MMSWRRELRHALSAARVPKSLRRIGLANSDHLCRISALFASLHCVVLKDLEARTHKFGSKCALRFTRQVPRLVTVATTFVVSGVVAYAQQPQHMPEARIVVMGEGSVSVAPNYLRPGAA